MNITNNIRLDIANSVMRGTLEKRYQKLEDTYIAIVEDVYDGVMSGYKTAIEALPKDLLNQESYFYVDFGAEKRRLGFVLKHSHYGHARCNYVYPTEKIQTGLRRPFPENKVSDGIKFSVKHAITKRYQKWENSLSTYNEDAAKLHANITAALSSVKTFKKLLEQWPEVKSYLPEGWDVPVFLPALPSKELNAMIKRIAK